MACTVIRSTTGTTAGDITHSLPAGFGTPTACIIIYKLRTHGTPNSIETGQDVSTSISFCDGTNIHCVGNWEEDAEPTSDCQLSVSNSLLYYDLGNRTSPQHSGAIPSGGIFGDDEIVIAHSGTTTDGELIIIAFNNSNVHVGNHQGPVSSTNEYTGAGFQANLAFFLNASYKTFPDGPSGNWMVSFSCVHDTGSGIEHGNVNQWIRDNQGTTANYIQHHSNSMSDMAWLVENRVSITNFTPSTGNGFTMNRVAGSWDSRHAFLLIGLGDDEVDLVGTFRTPAATGADSSFSSLAAVSSVIGYHSTDLSPDDGAPSTTETASPEGICLYAASEDGNEASIGMCSQTGETTSELRQWRDTSLISAKREQTNSGTILSQRAAITDWAPSGDGIELTWSDVGERGYGWMLLYANAAFVAHEAAGTGAFSGDTSGQAVKVHLASGTGPFTGLTAGKVVEQHTASGTGSLSGETSGRVVELHTAAGTGPLSALTAGTVIEQHTAAGTGPFSGDTSGQAVKIHVAAGTGPISAITAGMVSAGNVAVGLGDFTALTAGTIVAITVHQPVGAGSLSGSTAGRVVELHNANGSGDLEGLTEGIVAAPTGHNPTGAAVFSGLTEGRVNALGLHLAAGVGHLSGLTSGSLFRVPVTNPKRIYTIGSSERTAGIGTDLRMYPVPEA